MAVDGVREFKACELLQLLKYVLDYVFYTVCTHVCMQAETNWNYFQVMRFVFKNHKAIVHNTRHFTVNI